VNDPEFVKDFHSNVLREIDRLAGLTDNLLDLAKPVGIEMSHVNVADFCEEVLLYASERIERAGVNIERRLLPLVCPMDRNRAKQVMLNLILNACDAMPPGGMLRLASERRDDVPNPRGERRPHIVLIVGDNGAGMDEATRARMFDPYFTNKGLGRGLGLAGVLGVVRGHHGIVEVDSAPGRGTTVEVRLPAAPPAGPAAAPRDDADLATWRGHGTVVVADDEPAVRGAIAMVLSDAGFTVVEAADGAEALDAITAETVALIFDVTMPNLGGVEALRRLRAAGNGLPALLFCGYQETSLTAAATTALRPLRFLG
jgi:CheY-like chemotaxis protein